MWADTIFNPFSYKGRKHTKEVMDQLDQSIKAASRVDDTTMVFGSGVVLTACGLVLLSCFIPMVWYILMGFIAGTIIVAVAGSIIYYVVKYFTS